MKILSIFIFTISLTFNVIAQTDLDCLSSLNNAQCSTIEDADGIFFSLPAPGGSVPSNPFCQGGGVFENSQWISFVAAESDLEVIITPSSCDTIGGGLTGIQAAIWEGCPENGGECVFGNGNCHDTIFSIITSTLIPGNTYSLVFDGCGGSVCTVGLDINGWGPDQDPPTFDIPPSDIILNCDIPSNGVEISTWLNEVGFATISDNCTDTSFIAVSNNYDGTLPPCGASKIVNFTLEDDEGNTSQDSAYIVLIGTTVNFSQTSSFILEKETKDVCVSILGPSEIDSTLVTVSIIGSTAANGIDYESIPFNQMLLFPSGSNADVCFPVETIDDIEVESNESIFFKITNVVGGNIAAVGPLLNHVSTIIDDDDVDGDLVENSIDNCPNDLNPGQEDIDEDGIGDVCDPENIVTQLHEVRDNIFVNDSYSGVIVKSPDGKCWSIVVHNDGSMHTIKVKCP